MTATRQPSKWFWMLLVVGWGLTAAANADTLFQGRRIHLSNDDNRIFRVGVKGTTAGYNFLALVEGAKQEAVALGDMGYWEQVDDPPSFLRNYDLQLIVENQYGGKFQIEFEYDPDGRDIQFRIMQGNIRVALDDDTYYPTLVISSLAPEERRPEDNILPVGSKRMVFFDFNSFDADLRKYYGSVKGLLAETDYDVLFYYYESGGYDSYYFKSVKNPAQLDTDKMGLSLENGRLEYYQRILDNLKSRHGADFADQIIIISRFGKQFMQPLKQYAEEIGMSQTMVVTFWGYDDIE